MFGLNLVRAQSFQSNVFKVVLLAFLLLFTCALVTAVAIRFLDSSLSLNSNELDPSENLQQEKLLGHDKAFEVHISIISRIASNIFYSLRTNALT